MKLDAAFPHVPIDVVAQERRRQDQGEPPEVSCLAVRVKHPKGKPVLVRPLGLPAAALRTERPMTYNVLIYGANGHSGEMIAKCAIEAKLQGIRLILAGRSGDDLGKVATLHHRVVRRLRSVNLPVVCAVNGVAAGAGASYALACDIVLAGRSAKFIQAFVKIGLVPDSGASFFLPRLIGEARARALAMLGETVDAERAEAWGMIWRVVDRVLQIHGAMGYTRDLPIERIMREVRVYRIYEGTDEIHKKNIARGLLSGDTDLSAWN